MEKYLIIHPKDPTTTFLQGIYKDLPSKTVITGGITKLELQKKIHEADLVIACGHGSSSGLFGAGQFPTDNGYIIDDSMTDCLKTKTSNIYIWCNADQFVRRHSLNGLFTAMFISEASEALYYDFYDIDQEAIDESNNTFAAVLARYISEPMEVLYNMVLKEYGELAKTNPIASFNFERLFLSQPQPVMFSDKVPNIQ